MEGMDGITFLRHVRRDPGLTHLKVIMATSETSKQRVDDAMNSGAHSYIMKPFSIESFLTIVKPLLASLTPETTLDDIRNLFAGGGINHIGVDGITLVAKTQDQTLYINLKTAIHAGAVHIQNE